MLSLTLLHIKVIEKCSQGRALTIHRIGTVALEPSDFYQNVMYLPRVDQNKISVAQLAGDKLWAFEFHPLDVKDFKTGKEIRRGKRASLQPCNERS